MNYDISIFLLPKVFSSPMNWAIKKERKRDRDRKRKERQTDRQTYTHTYTYTHRLSASDPGANPSKEIGPESQTDQRHIRTYAFNGKDKQFLSFGQNWLFFLLPLHVLIFLLARPWQD